MSEAREIYWEALFRTWRTQSMVAGALKGAEVLQRANFGPIREAAELQAAASVESLATWNLPFAVAAKDIFEHQTNSLTALLHSAALIATHTALDDGFWQLFRAIRRAAPRDCEDLASDKTVRLLEIRDAPYESLLDQKLEKVEEGLVKESMPKKLDRLLAILKPGRRELNGDSFVFSSDKIKRLDEMRHDLAHRLGPREVEDIKAHVEYLNLAGGQVWVLAGTRYPDFLRVSEKDLQSIGMKILQVQPTPINRSSSVEPLIPPTTGCLG